MSVMADALQPFVVKELAAIAGRMRLMTLPDTLIDPLAAYDLNFDNAQKSIIADFQDATPVALALAADACRLSCASFQTISLAVDEMVHRDSMAWSLVKLYYSAFYAGNALIRLFGESCSYFDTKHILRVNQLAIALNRLPTFKVDGGLYRCVVNPQGTSFTCTRARSGIGGAHEAFWNIFGNRMRAISEGVLRGHLAPAEAQEVFAQIDRFQEIVRRKVNHGWLSVIRNEVQYRQEFRVWFPSQLRARERESLSRRASRWSGDPMAIAFDGSGGPLGEFITCCSFVVSLCLAILERIADRSSVGARSFVRLGPIAFLNDRAVA
jgi:hypothetical protein